MKTWIKKNWVSIVVIIVMSLMSLGVAFYETDFMHRDYNVPYTFGYDGMTKYVLVKSFQEDGLAGVWSIDRLGAPGQSTQAAIPNNDPLLVANMYVLYLIMPSITATLFAFYILTYLWTALAMYWLMRKLQVNPVLSGVLGLLFTCTPYHLMRALLHLSLDSLFTIPLGIAVAIYMYKDAWHPEEKPTFKKREIAVCAVICGLSNTYYVFFFMIMYAITFLLSFTSNYKEFRKIKSAFVYCKSLLWAPVLMVMTVAGSQIPRMIYCKLNHISNPMARSPFESEIYCLKLTQLFLPVEYHNIKAFRDFTNKYWQGTFIKTECMTLGLVAAIGIIVAFAYLFIMYSNGNKKNSLYKLFSNIVIWYVLVGSVGGVGLLFNMLVTSNFRCYSRMSVVLCCIGYIIVGLLLKDLSKSKKKLAAVLTVLALFVGLYDQLPLKPRIAYNPSYASLDSSYKEFFAAIEENLEPGSMVYQLPYVAYPESADVNNLQDYGHFKAYLYTNTIRWSYGGVKQVDTEAASLYVNGGASYGFVERLYLSGFSGVYIDTTAYTDGGENLIDFYDSFGVDPIISRDGSLYFYNLETIMDFTDDLYVENFINACGVEAEDSDVNSIVDTFDEGSDAVAAAFYDFVDDTEVITYESEDYVVFLYENVLERTASPDEVNYWQNCINEGMDYEDVMYSFVGSQEFMSSWVNTQAE